MFKAQYKKSSPYSAYITIGSYGTESQAISAALTKKNAGAIMVRVINKQGNVVYTG
ncbi:hypothetical protein N9A25_00225 [bacterium]|nr:hypothetical protein [bacterium]